jgi:hypothetical protein
LSAAEDQHFEGYMNQQTITNLGYFSSLKISEHIFCIQIKKACIPAEVASDGWRAGIW